MIAIRTEDGETPYHAICEICGARHAISATALRWRFGYYDVETATLQAHLVCSCELTLASVD